MKLLPWRVKLERKVHNFQSLLRWGVKHEQKSALVSRLVIAWREKHEVKSAFFYGLSVWQLKHEHVNIYSLRAIKLDDLFKNLCFLLTVFYWKFTMENWTPIYSHTKKKKKFRLNIEIIQYHLSYLFWISCISNILWFRFRQKCWQSCGELECLNSLHKQTHVYRF